MSKHKAAESLEPESVSKKPKIEALSFKIDAKCNLARAATITLPHGPINTPVFMPVGTKGAMKAMLSSDLEENGNQIILSNTYHIANIPGCKKIHEYGGLHKFMNWKRNLLTDSGGFQMVSLNDLMEINETGVEFKSHLDGSIIKLPPEESINIQNSIGADIIMQLDDVVHVKTVGPRVKEACERTVRWLDRCLKANKNPEQQALFPIVQGGVDPKLREYCLEELIKRNTYGYAIGGLVGGENKDDFSRTVIQCAKALPENKPRYLMGAGYPEDIVVAACFGVDMMDCVFPTRTARFGTALTRKGPLKLKKVEYRKDFSPIDSKCQCWVCKTYTKAFVSMHIGFGEQSLHLITFHNIHFQKQLLDDMRQSIIDNQLEAFLNEFFTNYYSKKKVIPEWIKTNLLKVGITIK